MIVPSHKWSEKVVADKQWTYWHSLKGYALLGCLVIFGILVLVFKL